MSLMVATYGKQTKTVHTCTYCFERLKKDEPIISYKDKNGNVPTDSILHLKCFFDSIKNNAPDFLREYILELM